MNQTPSIAKRDILFLAALVVLGISFTCWIFRPGPSGDSILEVRLNGKVEMQLPLNKNTDKWISNSHGTTNHFQIQDSKVKMIAADCHDQTCVSTRSISKPGETIVCLPHRLVLAIVKNTSQPDAVTR